MPDSQYRRFDGDIRELARQLDASVELVTRRIALQLFTGIVEKTPVDTGRARSNWGIGIGAPAPPPSGAITAEEEARIIRSGVNQPFSSITAEAIQEANAALLGVDGKQPVHITNNLPYIIRLNEGHSQQAPAGFVEATVSELNQQIIDTLE